MGKFEQVEARLHEVKNDYGNLPVKTLEEKYNASYSTIQRVLKKHGVIKGKPEKIKYSYVREHEEEFIKDWKSGILSHEELEEKYQCPYSNLHSRAMDLRLYRQDKIDRINHQDLIDDWLKNNCTNDELCNKYNISDSTLHKILHFNNINIDYHRNRKYYFDEKYFDKIDNEHKAYWLGFIYADGCHNVERYSLSIVLQENDSDLLWEFYEDIKCDKIVQRYYNYKYHRFYASVHIQHPHLSQALLNKGVFQNKSFKITFPTEDIIPKELLKHFVRGYFDGDGCLTIPKDKSKTSWSIIGNYTFVERVKQYIENSIPNYSLTIRKQSQSSNIYTIGKGGRIVVKQFLDWLYKDATIYLKRKYDKYLEVIEYNKEKENGKHQKNANIDKSA